MARTAAPMAGVGSFRFELETVVTVSAGGFEVDVPLSFVGDYRAPDSVKGKSVMSLSTLDVESEIVIIGDTIYATNPETGEWEVNSNPELLMLSPLDFVGDNIPSSDEFQGLELVGEEMLDGIAVFHLRGLALPVGFARIEGEARADFWIGARDLLIHRITIEGELPLDQFSGPLSTGNITGTAKIAATITFSAYGEPVTIEAPQVSADERVPTGPGERMPDQGVAHVALEEDHPPYNSVPATSGWHFGGPLAPAPWGVYDQVLPDEVLVHNLEHGGIGIHYDCPDGCPDLMAQLTALAGRYSKVIVSPYPGMEATIALTAWNFIDRFQGFDGAGIVAFIEAHLESPNAPEALVP
ncbi:MAG: DUF3105 domain-containing protein [SAR202 cluster bacterium]|nr:DUF3105 domain-containing protein [SAR202 cluster bacterium]